MRIGILGSGLMGGKLGTIFARAGHEVVFSYARSEQKINTLARDVKGKTRAGSPRQAAQDADAVLLAVHWSRIKDVLNQAGGPAAPGGAPGTPSRSRCSSRDARTRGKGARSWRTGSSGSGTTHDAWPRGSRDLRRRVGRPRRLTVRSESRGKNDAQTHTPGTP